MAARERWIPTHPPCRPCARWARGSGSLTASSVRALLRGYARYGGDLRLALRLLLLG